MSGARIAAIGIALPQRTLSNRDLARRLSVSEEWIEGCCGIETRHVADPSDTAASLGAIAAARALAGADVDAVEVDLIICATITAERRFPATACLIAGELGSSAAAYDLNAGCAGFLFALAQADAAVRAGSARKVLVVGSDVLTRITDAEDAQTSILFGDGAGAVVVEAVAAGALGPFVLHSDGTRPDVLTVDDQGFIRMKGRDVYRSAVGAMSAAVSEVMQLAGVALDEVDLVIAHQANQRILDAVGERLGIAARLMFSNIARYGNTSAASIPLALAEAHAEGRLQQGNRVVLTAFGAGFCWGAGVVTWTLGRVGTSVERTEAVVHA